jgi:mRNA-degrading endonuclease RelE of RelBE toxin-antitoxin system
VTGGPYEARITPRAVRDLRRLPEKVASACVEFIFGPLARDPRRLAKPLVGELAGHYAARRGSYRVVFRIQDRVMAIEVVHVAHRADVYR